MATGIHSGLATVAAVLAAVLTAPGRPGDGRVCHGAAPFSLYASPGRAARIRSDCGVAASNPSRGLTASCRPATAGFLAHSGSFCKAAAPTWLRFSLRYVSPPNGCAAPLEDDSTGPADGEYPRRRSDEHARHRALSRSMCVFATCGPSNGVALFSHHRNRRVMSETRSVALSDGYHSRHDGHGFSHPTASTILTNTNSGRRD